MHNSERELKIKKHVEDNQPIFDLMVAAAEKLASTFLDNGFNPRETDALPDTTMANEWYPFIRSNFYQLYNALIIPISITDTPYPGRAFKLFTGCFEIDRKNNEIRFNREFFIDFFNDEVGKRVKGMAFKYTCDNTEQALPEVLEENHKNVSLVTVQPETAENPVTEEKNSEQPDSEQGRDKNKNAPLTNQPKIDNSNTAAHGSKKENAFCLNGISMQILSGFMIAIGTAACALAITAALNAASFGLYGVIAASLGAVTLWGGLGLFAYSTTSSCQSKNEHDNKAAFSSMI